MTLLFCRKVNSVFTRTVRPWRLGGGGGGEGGTVPLGIKLMRSPVWPAVTVLSVRPDTTWPRVKLTAAAKPSSRQTGHGNSAPVIRYTALHFMFCVVISWGTLRQTNQLYSISQSTPTAVNSLKPEIHISISLFVYVSIHHVQKKLIIKKL